MVSCIPGHPRGPLVFQAGYCHKAIKVRWCYRPNGEVPLLAYSLPRLSFNHWSQLHYPAGLQRIVKLCAAGVPRDYYWY